MLETYEHRRQVWDWVGEVNNSVIFTIGEKCHHIVCKLGVTYSWLSICIESDLSQEARLQLDLNRRKGCQDTT